VIALATTAIAWIIALVLVIGWIVYAMFNARSARKEVGSELELAANRRPYYDDEELEGRRLELVQFIGVLMLAVIVVGLPLYWVFEPSRQAGAREAAETELAGWGRELFEPTADGGFNCAGCHGGMNATGGNAPFALTDAATGEVRAVTWTAPALNTVLYRFSPEEVTFIITYGRPGTPMSAWGLDGGGPMNAQQVESLVAYLQSIQIPREDCSAEEADDPNCPTGHLPAEIQGQIEQAARQSVEDGHYATYGEALFNLSLSGGAFGCARCHTPGWSYGDPQEPGQGSLGWNLTGGATNSHFENSSDMVEFVQTGTENGVGYAEQGQGSGKMPAFGALLTEEQIAAIVDYERSL
jgi:mono/diheme cytochrome c family protein